MKKWARWTVGIVLGFALLITFLWQNENRRGKRIWEETCERLRAAGEPVEIADIIPPMIPDEENAAMAPIFAELFAAENARETRLGKLPKDFRYTPKIGGEEIRAPVTRPVTKSDVTLLADWDAFFAGYHDLSPLVKVADPSPDRVLNGLARWDQEWNELASAMRRPNWRPPLNYDDARRVDAPHLDATISIRHVAQPRLVALAVKDDAQGYTDTLITCLKVAHTTMDPPVDLISMVLGIGSESLVLTDWQNTLACVNLSEAELVTLQLQAQVIDVRDIVASLRCERVRNNRLLRDLKLEEVMKYMEEMGSLPGLVEGNSPRDKAKVILTSCRPEGWKLAEAALHLDLHVRHVLACVSVEEGTISPAAVARLDRAADDFRAHSGWMTWGHFLAGMLEVNRILLRKGAKLQSRANGAVAWCAVERFRLKHGGLPARLEELVPEFIDKLPRDPVTGKALRYARKGERDFLVYSIGWDEKDDGGFEANRREEGDWVWASNPNLIVKFDDERKRAEEAAEVGKAK